MCKMKYGKTTLVVGILVLLVAGTISLAEVLCNQICTTVNCTSSGWPCANKWYNAKCDVCDNVKSVDICVGSLNSKCTTTGLVSCGPKDEGMCVGDYPPFECAWHLPLPPGEECKEPGC